jgi:ABC-type multidrug transport system ATPase subunit
MIKVSGLTKQYGNRTVVDDVSFALEPGTVTGFLGPNGAGKTTTMRLMTGLVPATSGTATVDGRPYADLPNPGAVVGTLIDASAVHPGRSGRTHLRLLADTIGVPSSRVDEVLELVGLPDAARRRVGGYSLGMRQRLGIAGALLADPPVLVFDEPANGLDPEGIHWLRGFLRHLAHGEGRTVLVSSHLLAEMEQTADRVVIVGAGRLVREGSLGELRSGARGSAAVLVRSPEAGRLAEVLGAAGFAVAPSEDGRVTVTGTTPDAVGAQAFRAGVELHELRAETSGLEELYFRLTAGQEQYAASQGAAR